jgi:non-ribosomal peptide synthetase component F
MAGEALRLPQALADALTHLSRQEGCTLFMILLAAWKILLYRDTGQTDLRVVTPIANRQRRETEGVIGLFTNTVLLRTDLSGHPTYREVVQRVRATALAAYANQQFPFEELVRLLEAERGLDRSSLSQVMVIWQQDVLTTLPYVTPSLSFLEVEQRILLHDVTVTTFDMILVLRSRRGELDGVCLYNAVRFDAATIRRMLEGFQRVLQELVKRPEQVISA